MRKNIAFLIFIFFCLNTFAQNSYLPLSEQKNKYFQDDSENKYHQEYMVYKYTTTKDGSSTFQNKNKKDFPWTIIDKKISESFFKEFTNSIQFEKINGDNIIYITTKVSSHPKNVLIKNLVDIKVLSSNIINSKTKKEYKWNEYLISTNSSFIPNSNPEQEKLYYFSRVENAKVENLSGTLNLEIKLPTEYLVEKISKDDIGKTIDLGDSQKIKIIEFVDNKVHFEILNENKLRAELIFTNVSSNIKSFWMSKYIYEFFRSNPDMDYKQFEKKYEIFSNDNPIKPSKNTIYIYTLEGKPDNLYFYLPKENTTLKKEIKVEITK